MRSRDKISKSAWSLFEAAKDSVSANLTNAVRNGHLKIEASQMPALLALVTASLDEGYHKGHRVFDKTVEQAIMESIVPAAQSQSTPVPAKKKKA